LIKSDNKDFYVVALQINAVLLTSILHDGSLTCILYDGYKCFQH